jgi:hypothetical protein
MAKSRMRLHATLHNLSNILGPVFSPNNPATRTEKPLVTSRTEMCIKSQAIRNISHWLAQWKES